MMRFGKLINFLILISLTLFSILSINYLKNLSVLSFLYRLGKFEAIFDYRFELAFLYFGSILLICLTTIILFLLSLNIFYKLKSFL